MNDDACTLRLDEELKVMPKTSLHFCCPRKALKLTGLTAESAAAPKHHIYTGSTRESRLTPYGDATTVGPLSSK